MPAMRPPAKALGLLILLASLMFFAGCGPPPGAMGELPAADDVHFSEQDRAAIREFFGLHPPSPTPGQPGAPGPAAAEQIEAAAMLPPDLAAIPLPAELEKQLSALPPGYIRFRAGDDVVLMDERTREVKDVVGDVLPP